MNDKNLMENLLQLEKGACGLFMHGALESSSANVNEMFKSALSQSLGMQETIFARMEERGWYAPDQAQQQKLNTVKQKFSAQ